MKPFQTLKKNWEFQETFKNGRSYANSILVLYSCPASKNQGLLKVAFCVGKKLGSAVRRNRIKRQLKNVFYTMQDRVARGCSVIIIAREKAGQMDYAALAAALEDLLGKAGLLTQEK
ncbi:MAG: ribonuclease P protein component [Firmicutes bacterium]|nr:ribonuclease P protein component [Bacillota bacterium]